jgi:hypothetical protein
MLISIRLAEGDGQDSASRGQHQNQDNGHYK